jgi:hypothetical protein
MTLTVENSGATIYQRYKLREAIALPWYEGNMLWATPRCERKSETAFHHVYGQNRVAASRRCELYVVTSSREYEQHATRACHGSEKYGAI